MSRRAEPYWNDARVGLEIIAPDAIDSRDVVLARPFGLIGSAPDNDIVIDDRSVSPRHAYLHIDSRGVFVVDLATRTGTRFDGNPITSGWLRPREVIEIGGWLIRFASMELDGNSTSPPPCSVNLLADSGDVILCGVSLEPVGHRGVSWALGSELVFVGRGDSCGIRLNRADVSNTHCALFRTPDTAFAIILPGQPTLVNGQSHQGARVLNDGDTLSLGQTRFIVKITPVVNYEGSLDPGRDLDRIPPQDLARLVNLPALKEFGGLPNLVSQSFPLELIPPESREAILGWMLGNLHAGQAEILRRQDDLQRSLELILQHIKNDGDARQNLKSDQIEALAVGFARLEAQIQTKLPSPSESINSSTELSRRPAREISPAPEINPARSLETAAWLLERIDKVGHENKISFRSFLGQRKPKTEPSPVENPSNQPSDLKTENGDPANRP